MPTDAAREAVLAASVGGPFWVSGAPPARLPGFTLGTLGVSFGALGFTFGAPGVTFGGPGQTLGECFF